MVRCGIHFNILRQAVLSTHFEGYEKGEALRDLGRPLFGTGVFNSDGLFFTCFRRTFLTLSCSTGERWK